MSIKNFIPTVWSGNLLVALKNALVYAQPGIVNRDYEGEISGYGDTVKINGIGAVSVGDYDGTSIGDPEDLDDTTRNLQITESKYFNFKIDDVDAAQIKGNVMQQAMIEAAYGLQRTADTFIANKYVDAIAGNLIGSDGSPVTFSSPSDAYELLVDISVLLEEANVPMLGRWVIVPAWFRGLLQKDDRFVAAGTAKTDSVLANGEIGEAAGLRVLVSNQVPNTAGTKYKIMAGYPGSITYAEQIVSVEAYRPENFFADAVKGLHVYGGKTTRPDTLVVATCNRPS